MATTAIDTRVWWRVYGSRWIPVAVFLLVCWPLFQSYFIGDDFVWLQLRQRHLNGEPLARVLLSPNDAGVWRPLGERVPFYLSQWLAPGSALLFRSAILLTQVGSLLLVAAIVLRLTRSRVAAVAAPIFWIVNPDVAETLVYCTAYAQVLCTCCLLLEFWSFLRYVDEGDPRWLRLTWAVFLFGFLVIESNLVFPALAGAYVLLFSRRHWKTVLPMASASILYVTLHLLLIPRKETGVYVQYLDPLSLTRTVWQYTKWLFRAPNIDFLAGTHWALSSGFAAVAFFTLLGFTIWTAWKRDFLAAMFAFFYLALIAPVAPLRDHLSGYYLLLPGWGIAMAAGLALSRAVAGKTVWRALGGVLVAVWIVIMIPGMFNTSRWWREYSRESKRFVVGLRSAREVAGRRPIVISGVSDRVYWNCLYYGCADAMGIPNWKLSPEWTPSGPPPAGLDVNPAFVVTDEVLADAVRADNVVYGSVAGSKFEDRTRTLKQRIEAGQFAAPARIDVGDPAAAGFLSGDWYAPEQGFRWMGRSAGVLLAARPDAARKLVLTGYCGDIPARPQRLEVRTSVNGIALEPRVLEGCKANFELAYELPREAPVLRRTAIRVELSETFRAPGDQRQLGLIFGGFRLE